MIFQFIRRVGYFVAIEIASLFCRCSIMGMIALESDSVFCLQGLNTGSELHHGWQKRVKFFNL